MPAPEGAWRQLAALALAGLVSLPLSAQQPAALAPPSQAALCAACHGPQGRAQIAGMPSLAGQPKLFTENTLVLVREGLRDIPAMKGMLDGVDDPQIIALAQYFAAQSPSPATPAPDAAAWQRGQALAARMHCASCHLPDYSGHQQVPRVAGQSEAYLLASMKQLRDRPGMGRDSIMAATLRGLQDGELNDLAQRLAHSAPAAAR